MPTLPRPVQGQRRGRLLVVVVLTELVVSLLTMGVVGVAMQHLDADISARVCA